MVTATTTRRAASKSEAPAPATFAEVAAAKMADTIAKYRTFVSRAAAGESLTPDELGQVLEALAYMRLPEFVWARDVSAQRDHTATTAAIAKAEATKDAEEKRLTVVTERIKQLDEEMKSLRAEHYTLATVSPMTRVGHMQRRNELTANHPHLFMDVADAVRLRQDAKDKAAGVGRKPASNEPMTTWSIGG